MNARAECFPSTESVWEHFSCCLLVIPGFCYFALQTSSVHTYEISQTASLNPHFMPGFPFLKWEEFLNKDGYFYFCFPKKYFEKKKKPCSAPKHTSMVRLQLIQPEASFTFRLHKSPQRSTDHLLAALQTSRSIAGATQLPSPLSGRLTGHARAGEKNWNWNANEFNNSNTHTMPATLLTI